ncbi:MAG: AMP-binding protein [Rhodocyclaceae bacterium]|nr:AMP-binding protein [Rhodocyclaceae bacterium]MBX3667860.1 AMP-binding protein [Rhodocyclaceae bacterium]
MSAAAGAAGTHPFPDPSTFPRLLVHQARVRGDRIAMREKFRGIWHAWTWREVLAQVRAMACGLAAQGFGRGDHLAIIGDNRPRLYWAIAAAQVLGGVPVPLYQDAVAAEVGFVLDNADISHALAEDQEQVDKLLEASTAAARKLRIYYDDPRGLRGYADDAVLSCTQLQDAGRAFDATHADFFERALAAVVPGDVAVMLYTSGTTGKPKGVRLTHAALIAAARGGVAFDKLGPGDEVLCYLPMAWVGDYLFSYAQAYCAGFTINCPESAAAVSNDMREIGPTYYFAPPRVFENLHSDIMLRMEDAARVKRVMFDYFMAVAERCGADILDRKPGVPVLDRLRYALGTLCVYAPLRDALGLARVRVAYTAGAAIGPELFRFYRTLGINLKHLYGSTETCAYICLQPDGAAKADSVGMPAPGVEIRIAAGGEVLVRSAALFQEYYRRPDASAAAMDAEGFFHTGDAGFFDADGQLKIIDRVRDVGRLAGGELFAPNFIESKLKFSRYVKEAVAFGDGRDQVCAFINIDAAAAGDWAERRGIAFSGYADLAGKPQVLELIRGCIDRANAELAADAMLSASQVRRFLVLHKELDPDDDELTRTRKVRRAYVEEKYRVLVDALYSGKTEQYIVTPVTFEDGRSGSVAATLSIVDCRAAAVAA